ncbi:carbohydrate-binding domain-containing protein [Actinoplanes sp. LDG1-06]|uniref:Carbohydrate-binding domain-containing protein n=1 Tax=Paractinoplanes ovalisporus TaxID=2810368 RepID=A0ABS2A296_9ACTN|nr:carbohydrate-binding domain-containing protein [Actinoplanes ovalisporus]MBM2613976.1 carbohydrate-binding domain-containing protein [Actinoplanes ovalisporus]
MSRRRVAPALLTTAAIAAWAVGASPAYAAGPAAAAALAANQADHDSAADHTWNESDVAAVTLTGSGATTTSPNVSVSGSTVTVNAAGTYRLSGSLTNGQIVVNSPGTGIVRLILNGVTVTSTTSAAVNVVAADEVLVHLQAGTTNRLTDAATYQYPSGADEPDAALFSAADLTVDGTGSLVVTGNAYDGIASKDGLVITAGSITVTAKDDAVRGRDYVVVDGGTVTATAGGDGLKATNDEDATRGYVSVTGGTVSSTATGDAVSAETDVIVSGGTITAKSGGGSTVTPGTASAKGLKAGVLAVISDGRVTVDASDDGVHSNGAVTIDGGTTTVATGDDGVHGETTVTLAAGTVNVTKSYEGIEGLKVLLTGAAVNATATDDAVNAADPTMGEMQNSPNALISVTGGTVVASGGTDALDSNGALSIGGGTVVVSGSATRGGGEGGLDSNGALTITGGTVLSTGISASTSTLPSSGQGWVSVTFSANQAAGTVVHLATTSGTQIAAFQPSKAFRGVVFSSSQITRGTTYAIRTGGTVSGTAVGGGLYTGGTLSGTQVTTVTAGTQTGGGRP